MKPELRTTGVAELTAYITETIIESMT